MKQATELKTLGNNYEENGDYESAELLFRKALCLQEEQLGEEHPSLAEDLHNLGLICYALDNYVDAELFLMRAWSIERNALGAMHPTTQATLEALSDLYYDADRNVQVQYKSMVAPIPRILHGQPASHMYH